MTPSRCAWEGYGLDRRLVKATKRAGWVAPTAVQERAIPLILKGKDMLCRARTGAGKTAAYLIPVLQKILQLKDPTTSMYSSFSSDSSFLSFHELIGCSFSNFPECSRLHKRSKSSSPGVP